MNEILLKMVLKTTTLPPIISLINLTGVMLLSYEIDGFQKWRY